MHTIIALLHRLESNHVYAKECETNLAGQRTAPVRNSSVGPVGETLAQGEVVLATQSYRTEESVIDVRMVRYSCGPQVVTRDDTVV